MYIVYSETLMIQTSSSTQVNYYSYVYKFHDSLPPGTNVHYLVKHEYKLMQFAFDYEDRRCKECKTKNEVCSCAL